MRGGRRRLPGRNSGIEPPSASGSFSRDQLAQRRMDQGCFLLDTRLLLCLANQLAIQVERCSHMHQYSFPIHTAGGTSTPKGGRIARQSNPDVKGSVRFVNAKVEMFPPVA